MTDEAHRIVPELIASLEEAARLYDGMAQEACRAIMPDRVHLYHTRMRALLTEAQRLRQHWRPVS